MKILFANGCSHTAGSDIDPNIPSSCVDMAWPRWVADHYGMQNVNVAVWGSGNEQISRSTIIKLSNLIEIEKVDPKDITAVICWSGFDRYEYWSVPGDQHKSFSMSSTNSTHTPGGLVPKYIELRSLMEPENYSNYKNLYYIYTTAKFLESYDINYYFSNALNSFVEPERFKGSKNLKSEYLNLLDLYGNRIQKHLAFFDNSKSFKSYLQGTPYSPYGNGYHWGEEGQKKYAKFFIDHMEDVNKNMGD